MVQSTSEMLPPYRKRLQELISSMWNCLREMISGVKVPLLSFVGAVGGFSAWFMGGIDTLLVTLITFMVIDYVTGVIRAIYKKKLSSAIGFKGIIKKMLMLIMVGVAVSLQKIMPVGVPLREMTVMFFIANEGFSVLENAAEVIPLPEKLKSVLLQLRKKAEDSTDTKETSDNNSEK